MAPGNWRSSIAMSEASAFQESHLRQVRSLLSDLDTFRTLQCSKKERADWTMVLKGWAFHRISRSRSGVCAATVLHWIRSVNPRLPSPAPAAALAAMVRGIATMSHLRPTNRARAATPLVQAALSDSWAAASSPTSRAVFMVVALMVRGGMRRSDATRVVCGDVEAWETLPGQGFVIFPSTEKTDMTGAREIEPFVFSCDSPWVPTVLNLLQSPFQGSGLDLENRVSSFIHDRGIPDVRALRRHAAETLGGRAEAGRLLRHREGSSQSVRYSTTRDAIEPAARRVRKVAFALSSTSPEPRPLHGSPLISSGPCSICTRHVPETEEAALCELCDEIACYDCHKIGKDYYCTEHDAGDSESESQ